VQTLPPSRKGYRSLVFSPDGSYLFFREEADPGSIYRTSVFGSAQKKIADRVWSDFAISPDGQQVAFIRRDSAPNTAYLLMVAGIDGGEEREVNSRQAPFSYRHALAYSPDGAKLLVSAGSLKDPLSKLLTVDVATGAETELKTPRWRAITRALWHPKGNYLVVSARDMNEATSQLWLLDYPEGEIRRLTNDLESYFWISLSIDGRMLVTRQQRIVTHLWLLPNGDVKKARQLTFGGRSLDGYVGLAWAPDGKIIFSGFADNLTDLYSLDSDGSNRVPLTANAGLDNNYPVISADGRFIVFTSNRTGVRQIWRMGVDGRNQKQLTFDGEHKDTAQYPAISPDGTEVFFIKYGTGPASIWKVSIDGGPSVPVSRLTNATAEGFLSISPDGKWLAYRHVSAQPEIGGEEPMMRVGVLPIDGNGEPKLFDLPMRRPIMHWTADSSAFDYAAGNFNASSLVRQPLVGDPQPLVALPDRLFNFAWSADRKNLVVSRGRQQGDAILITNLP
jgi:Tol biopolymer transport system component